MYTKRSGSSEHGRSEIIVHYSLFGVHTIVDRYYRRDCSTVRRTAEGEKKTGWLL